MNDAFATLERLLLENCERVSKDAARKRAKKAAAPTKARKQTLNRYMDQVLRGNDAAIFPDKVPQPESDKQRRRRVVLELLEELALKGKL